MSVRASVRRAIDLAFTRVVTRAGPGRILLYHGVVERPSVIEDVSVASFAEQLDGFASAGLTAGPVGDLVASAWPRDSVAVSFDDGRRSALHACERLARCGWSATLFLVPAWVRNGRRDVLTWSDAAALQRAGFEIGAHGLAHERCCGRDRAALMSVLREAREAIEQRLGVRVAGLAYPEGLASAAAVGATRAAGYGYACLTVPGANGASTDRYRLARNEVLATDTAPLVLAKLAGADDWFAPIRRLENGIRCASAARA